MIEQARNSSELSALAQELLERLGLRRLAEWTVPRDELQRELSAAIARELGLEPFAPASRGATRAWSGPGIHVVELDIPGFKCGTDVVSDTTEGIVLAAAQALDGGATARITSPEALDAELLAAHPTPSREELMTSHVYVWGKHADYEDDRYRRRHRGS
ncbi:hypothetical protein [Sorangium sp. So ce1151]|uniref:hypothetical protein n=1 Tax=Sorangium sp. So ce1151 TaxID=3133332 RepID=UPI003F63F66A